VAAALAMTHSLIATWRREGHWQLTEQDAKAYAQLVKNVARHYPIGVTQKGLDLYALGMCMASMEGSRVVASYRNARARRTGASSPPSRPATATVYPFPTSSPQPAAPSSSTAAPQQPAAGVELEGFTGEGVDSPIGGP
jgi:hypothetical protein